MLYFAKRASPPPPRFTTTIKTHSTAMACSLPRRGRKFAFVLARVADTTQVRSLTRLTNTIKCGLWPCMFCHECILVFPGRAGHALPRLVCFNMPTNAFFAHSSRICTLPSTGRECRSRLCFITFLALPFVSVFRPQRAPIHCFTTPEPQQQFPPYLWTF